MQLDSTGRETSRAASQAGHKVVSAAVIGCCVLPMAFALEDRIKCLLSRLVQVLPCDLKFGLEFFHAKDSTLDFALGKLPRISREKVPFRAYIHAPPDVRLVLNPRQLRHGIEVLNDGNRGCCSVPPI